MPTSARPRRLEHRRIRGPACLLAVLAGIAGIAGLATRAEANGVLSVVSPPQSPAFAPGWAHGPQDEAAPDPDIVRFGSSYFAYTTGTTWGNHIGVLRSSSPTGGFRTITGTRFGSSAFPSIPAGRSVRPWQVNSTQHAPGVFAIGGRVVMYYTAQTVSGHGGHYCLSVATASNPAGPFADHSSRPWLCRDAQGGAVDPSPFVDPAGRAWLYFKTYDDIEHGSEPARIFVVRLSADGLARVGGPRLVLSQSSLSSPYETVENPQMLYVGNTYVLLYSRGTWSTRAYREGYATCSGPAGPCREAKPAFLTSYGRVLGPGGATAFTDTRGRRFLAYHGWNGAPGCTGDSTSCARKLFVAGLRTG